MRTILAKMSQAITTQALVATVKAQAMKIQANQDVSPYAHQKVNTMTSHLRDFTRMNPPTFYGYKVDKDP